ATEANSSPMASAAALIASRSSCVGASRTVTPESGDSSAWRTPSTIQNGRCELNKGTGGSLRIISGGKSLSLQPTACGAPCSSGPPFGSSLIASLEIEAFLHQE
ncbi:MAG: hypothetical protein ACON4R_05160, partial [Akkermansiaceae bacterium]